LSEQSISVTINKTSATYTAPTAKSLTYTGSAQALINPGSSSVGKMYYKLGSDGEYQESIPTATNAGTYTVYYKVASTNSNYNDLSEKSISVTINKASATYTAPTNKNLTYNGSNQSLLNAGSSGVGTLYYHLSTSSSWSTSVPTATNAGTYIVVYKVVSTNSNYSSSSEQSISVTINKASAKYTAPTSKNLTYNGSAQALINAGSSSIGTIQYKLGASGTYSTSVPAATNAGTYTVYYKVTSTNSNYNDLSEKYVSVTISGLNLISKITTLAKSDTTNFAYDGTSDNNLRYIGSNPSNYVCFNSSCSNGKWRIIGIMNNIKTATHGTQSLVKIIRADFVGFYDWDSNSGNNWSSASLQTSLNSGELYTTYIKSYASLFETVTWNLGGTATYISSSNGLARHFYSYERGTTVYSGRPTTWSGKIGLIYPSDYGFATSGGSTTNRAACLAKELYNWNDSSVSDCRNNNYLSQSTGWTLTPYSENSKGVFTISSIVIDFDASGFSFSARPVGYLISNAKILSGNGTSSSPWVIGT
jgi:methionine-rich copper-binding protein CopC